MVGGAEMAINLAKHRESLLNAWKDVVDDTTGTDWALFGYEKQSNDLALVGKGDGGLNELLEELNTGKIMYAFCRVLDPNTSLHKYVLINWQGEGAPLARKGCCANHIHDVKNFFKGAHVTMNARTEDDVEPAVVLEKVAKSTGSKFNFQERSEPQDSINPVSSVYKRIQPSREINAAEREKFWMKEQEQEKQRIADEKQKMEAERRKLEVERKERELKEAVDREERVKERSRSIAQMREAEHNAQNTARSVKAEKMQWEKQMQDNARDESERRNRSESLRRERSQEAQSVISTRKINARAIFEQNSCAGQMSQFNNQHSQQETTSWVHSSTSPQATSPTSESKQSFQQHNTVTSTSTNNSLASSASSRDDLVRTSSHAQEEQKRGKESEFSQPQEYRFTGNLIMTKQESEAEPNTEEEQNWDEPSLEEPAEVKDPLLEILSSQSPQSQGSPQIITADGAVGLRARALYDYQAADDTEISFDPDEVITHIEQIDEGWWQGMAPDGSYGLFPANYVQLID